MTSADHVEYRRFAPAEADLLAEFLTTEDWPYHGTRGATRPTSGKTRQPDATHKRAWAVSLS
jgi:hypothetical protein